MFNPLTYLKTAPQFEIWHSHPDQISQVLITAGVDGDEYVGIAAAKHLIKNYSGNIPITIIPIVNIGGNQSGVSWNPLDKCYPKHNYPGSRFGSSSQRLMHQIYELTKGKKLWIDLHGGASNEHLNPFIWVDKSYPVLSYLKGSTVIEKNIHKNIPYIILEAGELGQVKQKYIDLHLNWINTILENLDKPAKPNCRPTYTKVVYEKYTNQDLHAKNVLWYSPTTYVSGKIV